MNPGKSFRQAGNDGDEQLRRSESARQTAILNALPAHIALLDTQGFIVSVNEAWRRFGSATAIQAPGHGIGLNYLEICDSARGEGSAEAHQAAAGIRSVLAGGAASFSIEYPCHSPGEQRWFLLTVTPLADAHPDGAVVMHSNITQRRRTQAALAQSEDGLHRAEVMAKLAHVVTGAGGAFERWSESLPRLVGVEPDQLPRTTRDWLDNVHRDDQALFRDKAVEAAVHQRRVDLEYRLQRADGEWINVRQTIEPIKAGDEATGASQWFNTLQDITSERQAMQSLRESEARFRSLTELSSDWFWEQDEAYRFVGFSGGGRVDGWGQDQDKAIGVTRWDLPDIEPLSQTWSEHKALLEEHKPFRNFEYRRVLASGVMQYVAASGEPIFDAGGGFTGYRGVATDITERKLDEIRITRLNRVYAVLSGINALIVRARGRDELLKGACAIAVGAGGFKLAWTAVVERSTMRLKPMAWEGAAQGYLEQMPLSLKEDDPDQFGLAGQAVRDRKPVMVEDMEHDPRILLRTQARDRDFHSLVVLPLVVSEEAVGVLALYANEIGFFNEGEMKLLTELAGNIAFAIDHIGKQERLDYLAYYDPLTGLANRSLFLERISQGMRSAARDGRQLALFLVDLERFKNINDSLGRDAGDALLKQVAQWLALKVADVNLLARIDADHFAVVLPEVSADGSVARLLDRAMDAFEEHPFHLEGGVFRIATKAGVALFPADGATADALFKNAEAALKKAKASGDRFLFYTPQMTDAVAGKLTLENQLREALDKGQFVLHYQPKMNLASGKLTGAEALIRWNDPRTGLVPPGRFIPILEETGMITEVGRWALRQAVADYLRWLDAGLPAVRIAVNVSPLQLRNRDFTAEVAQAVASDARAPAGLELEITENLIMEDVKRSIATLRAIRGLGVTIAIDDFGTGFSSLSYLSKLPVDTLKIDRSFVIEMTAPEAMSLVPAIIGLAHSLKLKVVAEGVETEDQSRLLRLLGCDEMQGYLFGRPVPVETFEASYLQAPR